jgi:hydrogenase maturation protein HypF
MTSEGHPYPIRRSRGFAPRPVALTRPWPAVLALGAQDKNAICLIKDRFAFMSPHIGDLETPEARDFLAETIGLMERLAECRPPLVACDLHPGYHTSRVARSMEGRQVIAVQHHHAHCVSVMAEHGLTGSVIGLALDGDRLWHGRPGLGRRVPGGGRRRLHPGRPPALPAPPGGRLAVGEPWRMAAALLHEAFGPEWRPWAERLAIGPATPAGTAGSPSQETAAALDRLEPSLAGRIPLPRTSSLGRLFDGVAALLDLRQQVSFEGQAAMALEACACGTTALELPFVPRHRTRR